MIRLKIVWLMATVSLLVLVVIRAIPDPVTWIRDKAIVFETSEPESGFKDLLPLKELIGDARIVALGEQTHGTHEFFQMKHRLVEFLSKEMGFTVFAIENGMAKAELLNAFVLGGEGNSMQLLEGMSSWPTYSQEVLNMIHWMRSYNESAEDKIQFTGFDIRHSLDSMEAVIKYMSRGNPEYSTQAKSIYADLMRSGGPSGTAIGTFPHDAVAGKRIRYSGYIKTQDVARGYANLWWRADGPEKMGVAFDKMRDRPVKGTTDWTQSVIELDLPPDITNVNFGVGLNGSGTAWFDGLKVEIDGVEYRHDFGCDLDFEESSVRGFRIRGWEYDVSLDEAEVRSGRQSLRVSQSDGPARIERMRQLVQNSQKVVDHLQDHRQDYAGIGGSDDLERAIQNARIVVQSFQSKAGEASRDLSMAENVRWLLEQYPKDTKIVLWAHNWHVSRAHEWLGNPNKTMGYYLSQWYGEDYLPIGFATYEGRYTALGDNGIAVYDLLAAKPGSLEHYLHGTGYPRLILDLRELSRDSQAPPEFAKPLDFRLIGATADDEQFFLQDVPQLFDAIIFFDKTQESLSYALDSP